MKINGAQAIVKSLENEGVDIIFGIPGGANLPLMDALQHSKKIRFILTRHEQVAAHAADGYARATGRVGVCLATSGPGATNLVTGIANAYMDSAPIVALTGQVPVPVIGTDAFQEADITGITLPIVKHNYLVNDANDFPDVIKEAFYIAGTGRPGPVLIDIPRDVTQHLLEYHQPHKADLPGYRPTIKGHKRQIKEAAKLIVESRSPVIYVGGGIIISNADKELSELIEATQIPVTTTLMGKGSFPERHELSLGMLGMHGTKYANFAMCETDLIIALGARFDDRVTGKLSEFAPKAKIIHLDIDPAEISKNVPAHIPIVGDAKSVLPDLVTEVAKLAKGPKLNHAEWLKTIAQWKKKHPLKYRKDKKLRPEYIVEAVSELTQDMDSIVTTGVGQCQMWAALYYKTTGPRSFISSGGLGTMGFGMPAAIGAQFGRPQAKVVVIDGDGSFQMVSQDLATAVGFKLPIVIAIMNNGYLGMVRQWQQLFYDRRYFGVDLSAATPDFVKLAEAYGAIGKRVERTEDVYPVLEEALGLKKSRAAAKSGRPTVIDFRVEREDNVYPMVAPGAPLGEMLDGNST